MSSRSSTPRPANICGSRTRLEALRCDSTRSALNSPNITRNMTNPKGNPMMTVAACSAGIPPTASIAMVSSPVVAAHTIRSHALPSCSARGR